MLSSRVTVSYWPRVSAWPRRSKVRQAQPSWATARALARYCSWQPPQPCTNSVPGVPGSAAVGVMSVPSILVPLTGIAIASVRSSMRLHDRVFNERPGLRVDAAEMHPRAARRLRGLAVRFGRARAHRTQARIGAESLERSNFGATRAADAPRLLEDAAMPAPAGIASPQHVVVAARGEQAGKLLRRSIERHGLADRHLHVLFEFGFQQHAVVPPHDDQVRPAVRRLPVIVGGHSLRAAVRGAQAVDAHLADAVG